ncbi:MAG: hypothetical protein EZS28_023073, partial [Streblomastix strix]
MIEETVRPSSGNEKEKELKFKELEEQLKQKDKQIMKKDEQIKLLKSKNIKLKKKNTNLKDEIKKIKHEYPQVIPHEYNVVGGLLGLGQDILLEVLSEMRFIPNAIQFLGICKKTFQLKNHSRFYKIIETLNYPIAIINKDPQNVEFVDIDGVQKKINKKKDDYQTISLTQVLENGIWSLESMLRNSEIYGAAIGIVRDSYDIPAKAYYADQPNAKHIAAFCGKGRNCPVWYKGQGTEGNARIQNNQIVRLEFDSFKGTLILFINNVQQPVYFAGIKEKVRFIIFLCSKGTSCIIQSLKKLKAPTSKPTENTLYRRNILCGYGSQIVVDAEPFSEDGAQRESLWILKTSEGITLTYTDTSAPGKCLITGTAGDKPYSLFVPIIEEAKADESEDRYGADITIKGSHFVRCGMMQYEICEYEKPKEVSKTRNDDPPPVEEAPQP